MKISKKRTLILIIAILIVILAVTIVSCTKRMIYRSQMSNSRDAEIISEEQAIAIALEKVPGATKDDVRSFRKEYDDGWWNYEGEIRYEGIEYEFEIDAHTGNILEWEMGD